MQVSKSERYKSGYWVIKMFVWRLEEYSKLVYIDGDVYFRQSADELFCAPVSYHVPPCPLLYPIGSHTDRAVQSGLQGLR